MNKQTVFILGLNLLFLFDAVSQAQIVQRKSLPDRNVRKAQDKKMSTIKQCVQSVLHKQFAEQIIENEAAKTTSVTAERLKAFGGYNYLDTSFLSGGKSDSAYYVYTGNRGSMFNLQSMEFSPPSLGTYTSPIGDDYLISFTYVPVSYGSPYWEIIPDSVYTWNSFMLSSFSGLDTFGYADKSYYSYTAMNNVSLIGDQYYPLMPGAYERRNYYYDGVGKLISALYFSYNTSSSSWDTTNAALLYYNSSGNVIMDSSSIDYGSGLWGEDSKDIYSYDGSGNMVYQQSFVDSSNYWQPKSKNYLTFYGDNTLHTDSTSNYDFGLWHAYAKDSFSFTSGISYFTYCQTKMFLADTVYAKSMFTKHVSASGLPDTTYFKRYGGYPYGPVQFNMGMKTSFIYDSYKNPVIASAYRYNITDTPSESGFYNASPERTFYYYYELYTSSGVKDANTTTENIKIYPNPTTNEVTISRPDAVKGSYTFIILTNAMGQTIRTESLPWMNETMIFSLAGLAPGLYMLSVQDKNGNNLSTQKIIKQ